MTGGRAFPIRFAALLCILTAPAAGTASSALALDEIARGVFVHPGKPLALDAQGHDDIANIGFIVGARCVAVIDTGGSVHIGRALHAAIRARTSLPICYVINTHVHVDHVLGNAAFRSDGAKFAGHALLPDALMRSREFFVKNYAEDMDAPASPEQIIGPDLTVAAGSDLDLDLGARRLTLHAWPKAHTDCDLTVYDAKTGTLWTGDLLFVQRTPALDGSIKGWLAAIDALSRMQVKHVIPGHGGVSADLPGALAPERRYLEALLDQVRAQIEQGKPLQEAIREVTAPDQAAWLLFDATNPHNVARVYQELEWE